jgi:Smg protein
MKDNLFEMLLNLFEKSMTQLQKSHIAVDNNSSVLMNENERFPTEDQSLHVKSAHQKSTRVFTYEEQMKLTKASYQFLMRMKLWTIIDTDLFESILNQLQFSESRIVTLQETKWTIRTVLATRLNEEQLSFLDLVLYQTEDELTKH